MMTTKKLVYKFETYEEFKNVFGNLNYESGFKGLYFLGYKDYYNQIVMDSFRDKMPCWLDPFGYPLQVESDLQNQINTLFNLGYELYVFRYKEILRVMPDFYLTDKKQIRRYFDDEDTDAEYLFDQTYIEVRPLPEFHGADGVIYEITKYGDDYYCSFDSHPYFETGAGALKFARKEGYGLKFANLYEMALQIIGAYK